MTPTKTTSACKRAKISRNSTSATLDNEYDDDGANSQTVNEVPKNPHSPSQQPLSSQSNNRSTLSSSRKHLPL